MYRARYTARAEDRATLIEDQDRGRSVTNDAENGIADLRERGFDPTLPVNRGFMAAFVAADRALGETGAA